MLIVLKKSFWFDSDDDRKRIVSFLQAKQKLFIQEKQRCVLLIILMDDLSYILSSFKFKNKKK